MIRNASSQLTSCVWCILPLMTSNEHDFLGMKIRMQKDQRIEIDMQDQIKKLLEEFFSVT